MLRGSWRLRSWGVVWLLLVWFVVPVVGPLAASVNSASFPGIVDDDEGVFDDADDDGIIATLPDLNHKLVAPLPSLLPDPPQTVGDPAPAETHHPAPVAFVSFTPSRSPPLS